jgi:branched-subunit amino acid ABC-type transport system permease component
VSLWVQIVLSGLAAGSVYGLIGIGHTLVHRLIGIVHFALGDLVGLGVFLTLLVTSGRGPVTQPAFAIQAFLAALFGRPAYVFPDPTGGGGGTSALLIALLAVGGLVALVGLTVLWAHM